MCLASHIGVNRREAARYYSRQRGTLRHARPGLAVRDSGHAPEATPERVENRPVGFEATTGNRGRIAPEAIEEPYPGVT